MPLPASRTPTPTTESRQPVTEQIPDGEPMVHDRDFTVGDRYPADFNEWLDEIVGRTNPPYLPDWTIEKGDRVGYEHTNGDIIIGTLASIDPGPRGSQTFTLDDNLEYLRRRSIYDVFREVLGDSDLTWTYQGWMPGDPIPYDEMRRILGLPDVRDEVIRMRTEAAARDAVRQMDAIFAGLGDLFRDVDWKGITASVQAIGEATRRKQATPFWAEQPNKQRRTKYGPTRRVK